MPFWSRMCLHLFKQPILSKKVTQSGDNFFSVLKRCWYTCLQKGIGPILHYVPLHSFKSAQLRLAPQLSCLSRPWQKCFFGTFHKWRHHFSSSFWPLPTPRYPFCIIYFPSIFDTLPHLRNEDVNYGCAFIVEPATFMHPSKFERKKNDRFFLAPWW